MTTFEHEFEVDESPDDAWQRLIAAQPADTTPGQWWLPGFDATGEELEVEAGRRLSVRKATMPCEGTIIDVTFEHVATGTRIRVVQSGFDEEWIDAAGDGFWAVADHIRYDVELFFRRGIVGGRHSRPFAWFGWFTAPTSMGLEVTSVLADTYAARAGVETGDVIVAVGGAPVVDEKEMTVLSRVLSPGQTVVTTVARRSETLELAAAL